VTAPRSDRTTCALAAAARSSRGAVGNEEASTATHLQFNPGLSGLNPDPWHRPGRVGLQADRRQPWCTQGGGRSRLPYVARPWHTSPEQRGCPHASANCLENRHCPALPRILGAFRRSDTGPPEGTLILLPPGCHGHLQYTVLSGTRRKKAGTATRLNHCKSVSRLMFFGLACRVQSLSRLRPPCSPIGPLRRGRGHNFSDGL
jgi:hypothetical protein